MAKRHSRASPIDAVVDERNTLAGAPIGKSGERVKILGGDVPNEEGDQTTAHAQGVEGRIDGLPYVSPEGPNKGKIIQPIKADDGRVLGVTTNRLQRRDASKSRGNFATSAGMSQSRFDSIFSGSRRKRSRWVDIGGGRQRLA